MRDSARVIAPESRRVFALAISSTAEVGAATDWMFASFWAAAAWGTRIRNRERIAKAVASIPMRFGAHSDGCVT